MKSSTLFTALCAFAGAHAAALYEPMIHARQLSATTTDSQATPTGVPAPGPTQADVAADCNRWDFIASGANCQNFVNLYPEISLALLYQWNPSTGPTCNNLWQDYYICTRTVSFSAPGPSPTPDPGTPVPPPGPTQPGPAATCNRWDFIPAGASCQTYTTRYPGLTTALLIEWNPAIGSTCSLWAEYWLCTSIVGYTTSPSSTTSQASTSPAPTNPSLTTSQSSTPPTPTGTPAPGQTQPGVIATCNRWDLVVAGTTCQAFINQYPGVTLALLFEWNPAIGATCTNLWADYYVCTGVAGSTNPTTSAPTVSPTTSAPIVSSTSASPPVGVPAPGQTQPGVATNCSRWDLVTAGATCANYMALYPGLTLAQMVAWNPAIGATCNNLWLDYYVCTAVSG